MIKNGVFILLISLLFLPFLNVSGQPNTNTTINQDNLNFLLGFNEISIDQSSFKLTYNVTNLQSKTVSIFSPCHFFPLYTQLIIVSDSNQIFKSHNIPDICEAVVTEWSFKPGSNYFTKEIAFPKEFSTSDHLPDGDYYFYLQHVQNFQFSFRPVYLRIQDSKIVKSYSFNSSTNGNFDNVFYAITFLNGSLLKKNTLRVYIEINIGDKLNKSSRIISLLKSELINAKLKFSFNSSSDYSFYYEPIEFRISDLLIPNKINYDIFLSSKSLFGKDNFSNGLYTIELKFEKSNINPNNLFAVSFKYNNGSITKITYVKPLEDIIAGIWPEITKNSSYTHTTITSESELGIISTSVIDQDSTSESVDTSESIDNNKSIETTDFYLPLYLIFIYIVFKKKRRKTK